METPQLHETETFKQLLKLISNTSAKAERKKALKAAAYEKSG